MYSLSLYHFLLKLKLRNAYIRNKETWEKIIFVLFKSDYPKHLVIKFFKQGYEIWVLAITL